MFLSDSKLDFISRENGVSVCMYVMEKIVICGVWDTEMEACENISVNRDTQFYIWFIYIYECLFLHVTCDLKPTSAACNISITDSILN